MNPYRLIEKIYFSSDRLTIDIAMRPIILLLSCLIFSQLLLAADKKLHLLSAEEVDAFVYPEPYVRIPYGDDTEQFADLRVPEGSGSHPVIIWIHGGCWLAEYGGVSPYGKLLEAFAKHGIASWNIEYRRIGNEGGGWPGTFQDVIRGADKLLEVAEEYNLDTTRVVAGGHSAGGHLALWLGARGRFNEKSLLSSSMEIQLQGIFALAPAADLAYLHEQKVCGHVVDKLMGGSPQKFPERYAQVSATELVPIGLPQLLIIGEHDKKWRPVGERYYQAAEIAGDEVRMIIAAESGHFEMMDPDSSSWPLVLKGLHELMGLSSK